ncbi:MAG: FliM/FliN family flagellar motor switch protein, partial [Lentisphaeraceae bacterium]|nr:FliM/FliN family flagellar motor switch protein [Lentisphaeraceae bacterium]
IKVGQANGTSSIAYPLPTVQQLIVNLDSSSWMSDNYYGKMAQKNYKVDLMHSLAKLKLPVTVDLGEARLTSTELQDLEPGDVIILNKKFNELLDVNVGTMKFAKARPGRVGKSVSIKVTEAVKSINKTSLSTLVGADEPNQ